MHYGKEVIYQCLQDESFRDYLKLNNIDYVDLPILENDVLTYVKDGVQKYACIEQGIAPDSYIEHVYLTENIPIDLSWNNLIADCKDQYHGEAPMPLKTKAKAILEKASKLAAENKSKEFDWFGDSEVTTEEIKRTLGAMGYYIGDILSMDHHDVDDDFLNTLL